MDAVIFADRLAFLLRVGAPFGLTLVFIKCIIYHELI